MILDSSSSPIDKTGIDPPKEQIKPPNWIDVEGGCSLDDLKCKFESAPIETSPDISNYIAKMTRKIRGKELEILDEFAKAFLASETLTGKDLVGVIKDYELIMATIFNRDGSYTIKYGYEKRTETRQQSCDLEE